MRAGIIQIKIAESFRSVPQDILEILGLILISKLFRYQINRKLRAAYREYVNHHILPQHREYERKPSRRYNANGQYYNLEEIFDGLNKRYFNIQLNKPLLGWSLNKSYSRLGFYSPLKKLLVISRIFDAKKVPLQVVEYLVYHEMLHIYIPPITVNGRRRLHTPEFRRLEKSFPNYEKMQKWIHKYRKKMMFLSWRN